MTEIIFWYWIGWDSLYAPSSDHHVPKYLEKLGQLAKRRSDLSLGQTVLFSLFDRPGPWVGRIIRIQEMADRRSFDAVVLGCVGNINVSKIQPHRGSIVTLENEKIGLVYRSFSQLPTDVGQFRRSSYWFFDTVLTCQLESATLERLQCLESPPLQATIAQDIRLCLIDTFRCEVCAARAAEWHGGEGVSWLLALRSATRLCRLQAHLTFDFHPEYDGGQQSHWQFEVTKMGTLSPYTTDNSQTITLFDPPAWTCLTPKSWPSKLAAFRELVRLEPRYVTRRVMACQFKHWASVVSDHLPSVDRETFEALERRSLDLMYERAQNDLATFLDKHSQRLSPVIRTASAFNGLWVGFDFCSDLQNGFPDYLRSLQRRTILRCLYVIHLQRQCCDFVHSRYPTPTSRNQQTLPPIHQLLSGLPPQSYFPLTSSSCNSLHRIP